MIIVHVLSSFDIGGQEVMAADLASRQKTMGHGVFAVSLSPNKTRHEQRLKENGIATFTVGKRSGFDVTLPLRLARLFSQLGADVVHTHNPQALIYGAPAGKLIGAAVVHTKHGANPDRTRRVLLRRAAALCTSAYIAVSETTAEVARSARECAPSKLKVVSNGIDVRRFAYNADARRDVRRELGIPMDAWVIGSVGRLAPEKNYSLLIAAATPLLDEEHHLVFVGDGPERAILEAEAKALPVKRFVHFTGMRSDTPRLYSAFDVFCLSSITEGLPLVIPEAMAAGLPIVSTAVGGIPNVVRDGETGLLVRRGDEPALRQSLQLLAVDRSRARSMGVLARRIAHDRYSSDRMLDAYMQVYHQVTRHAWKPQLSLVS